MSSSSPPPGNGSQPWNRFPDAKEIETRNTLRLVVAVVLCGLYSAGIILTVVYGMLTGDWVAFERVAAVLGIPIGYLVGWLFGPRSSSSP